jgi:hypothetical protein
MILGPEAKGRGGMLVEDAGEERKLAPRRSLDEQDNQQRTFTDAVHRRHPNGVSRSVER